MLKVVLAGMLFLLAAVMSGCAGASRATLAELDGGKGIAVNNLNASVFHPTHGAVELATAYSIKRDADTRAKMAENMLSGKTVAAPEGKLLIGFINNDPKWAAYVMHPDMPGQRIDLPPNGGYDFAVVATLPKTLVIYRSDGQTIEEHHPDAASLQKKKMVGNRQVDYRITINRINN